jgi:glutamate racemase
MTKNCTIGIFDSGYGGLTVFKSIVSKLPNYDYLYLGDNARSPYGDHSFDTVYKYTLECVEWLFSQGCPLVILACNTASAKALRTIQQVDIPKKYPNKRVLGVIRPTAEIIGEFTLRKNIGIMGTRGTISSKSYPIEINKFFPELKVYQQSCPMWVPLIENNEHLSEGADFFVQKYIDQLLAQSNELDCILLACTHYPLMLPKISKYLPKNIKLLTQGEIVANSLADYLKRHNEIDLQLTKNSHKTFYTTGEVAAFDENASLFMGQTVKATKITI